MTAAELQVVVVPGLADVEPAAWDALVGDDNPFVEHAFLHGLEVTGCVGPGTGWQPLHLLVVRAGDAPPGPQSTLLGAAPLYAKTDSLGEFIFDFAWAHFYAQHGQPYYPKLVAAVPFTPVTGPRLLVHPDADAAVVRALLADAARSLAARLGAHSAHWLFVDEPQAAVLAGRGYLRRLTEQALWLNAGYRDFEDFLATRRAPARKQIRRERRDAQAQGLALSLRTGTEMGDEEWAAVWRFYTQNVDRHGSDRYLNEAFFRWLRAHFAHRVVCTLARGPRGYVAGTLNFAKGRHLYGRYWGCTEAHPFLHFELGFYMLMQHCIEQGLTRFEAGAGGEHKIKRGMELAPIHSAHWLADRRLAAAVATHLEWEREATGQAIAEAAEHSTRRRAEVAGQG